MVQTITGADAVTLLLQLQDDYRKNFSPIIERARQAMPVQAQKQEGQKQMVQQNRG